VRRAPKKAARVDADDPQKEAVYSWEDSWGPWNYNSLTLSQCREWIKRACKLYGVEPPRVRQHRRREYSWCHVILGIISIQGGAPHTRGGRNCATALHEVAHWITYKKFSDKVLDHGPTFLGVFMYLLEEAEVAPPAALHASARTHKLKWRKDVRPCKG